VKRSKNFLEFPFLGVGRLRVLVDIREQENRRQKTEEQEARLRRICAALRRMEICLDFWGFLGHLVAFWRRLGRMRAIQLEAGLGGMIP